MFFDFPAYASSYPTTPIHAAGNPLAKIACGAYRFGLFPFRSPLLREYTIVLFSSGY